MKYLDLYYQFRVEVDDTGGDTGTVPVNYTYYWESDDSGCLWKNTDLVNYLNRTLREITVRRPLVDSTSPDICEIPILSGTATYCIDNRILYIIRAVLEESDGTLTRLTKATPIWLDNFISDWETTSGTPRYYVDNFHEHAITVTPVPDAAATIKLTVGRLPLEETTWARRNQEFSELDTYTIPALLEGMKMHAYRKRDADTSSVDLARLAETNFARLVGPPRSLENLWARRTNADRGSFTNSTARAY